MPRHAGPRQTGPRHTGPHYTNPHHTAPPTVRHTTTPHRTPPQPSLTQPPPHFTQHHFTPPHFTPTSPKQGTAAVHRTVGRRAAPPCQHSSPSVLATPSQRPPAARQSVHDIRYPIPFHPVPFHLAPSHPIPSRRVPSHHFTPPLPYTPGVLVLLAGAQKPHRPRRRCGCHTRSCWRGSPPSAAVRRFILFCSMKREDGAHANRSADRCAHVYRVEQTSAVQHQHRISVKSSNRRNSDEHVGRGS